MPKLYHFPAKKEKKKIEDTTDYTIFPQHKKLAKQKTTVLIFLFNLLAICVRGPTFSQTNEIYLELENCYFAFKIWNKAMAFGLRFQN